MTTKELCTLCYILTSKPNKYIIESLANHLPGILFKQPSLPLSIQLPYLDQGYSTFSRLCLFAISCTSAFMTTLPYQAISCSSPYIPQSISNSRLIHV